MMSEGLTAVRNKLLPIFERYGILRAIVFGSFARGEPSRRSDLDLFLVMDTEKRYLDRFDGILGEVQEVVRERDVELLIYTPDELQRAASRRFIRTILEEGVEIYESER